MKNYSGNYKPFILVLAASDVMEKINPVLEELSRRSLNLCVVGEKDSAKGKINRACGVIAFLSEGFSKSERLQKALIDADNLGTQIIPVYTDDSSQSELVKRVLFAKNAVDINRYPDPAEFAQRLLSADVLREPFVTEKQKKAARTLRAVIITLAVAIAALGAAFIISKTGRNNISEYDKAVLDSFGYTEEELAQYGAVMIIGDEIIKVPQKNSQYGSSDYYSYGVYTHNTSEDDWSCWYYNDVETYGTGKVRETDYQSLSFLNYLPNLEYVALIKVNAEALPDLSRNANLKCVSMSDCDIKDISGLANSSIVDFESHRNGIENYDILNSCSSINCIKLDLYGDTDVDMTGFHPETLERLEIENYTDEHPILALDSLSSCVQIKNLVLAYLNTRDMSFIGNFDKLEYLYLQECNNVSDVSCLENCKELQEVTFQDMRSVTDLSCLTNLENLRDIHAHCEIRDLNFLKGLTVKEPLSLHFSRRLNDYSGLDAIDRYGWLHVNLDNGNYELVDEYLKDKTINSIELYQLRIDDISSIPKHINSLTFSLTDLTSLDGIDNNTVTQLCLNSNLHLQSLSGLENLPNVSLLDIQNTPITDFDAMYDSKQAWNYLGFAALEELPDFSKIQLSQYYTLKFNSIRGITDVEFLNDVADANESVYAYEISLVGLDDVTDISPLKRFKGHSLIVSPQMESQARELVEEGMFEEYSVQYPDYGWDDTFENFTLKSLDELDTLMPSYLSRISNFRIAGDTILNSDMYVIDEDNVQTIWERDVPIGELGAGKLENFDKVSRLTGATWLELWNQPLSSINGIQTMNSLSKASFHLCNNLRDASPAFTVISLEELEFDRCPIGSLQGIQNLYNLKNLKLTGCRNIKDLSLILELEGLEKLELSSDMVEAIESLEEADYRFELVIY